MRLVLGAWIYATYDISRTTASQQASSRVQRLCILNVVDGQKVMHDSAATVVALGVVDPTVHAEAPAIDAGPIRPSGE